MSRPPARIKELERLISRMDDGIIAAYETIDLGRKRKEKYQAELARLRTHAPEE